MVSLKILIFIAARPIPQKANINCLFLARCVLAKLFILFFGATILHNSVPLTFFKVSILGCDGKPWIIFAG